MLYRMNWLRCTYGTPIGRRMKRRFGEGIDMLVYEHFVSELAYPFNKDGERKGRERK